MKKINLIAIIAIAAAILATVALFIRAKSPDVINKSVDSYTPALVNNVTNRGLNSPFLIDSQRDCIVAYNVNVTSAATLVLGSQVNIFLDTKISGTWTTISNGVAGIGSGLVVTGYIPVTVFGVIRKGDSVRIRTTNMAGTPTSAIQQGMEAKIN